MYIYIQYFNKCVHILKSLPLHIFMCSYCLYMLYNTGAAVLEKLMLSKYKPLDETCHVLYQIKEKKILIWLLFSFLKNINLLKSYSQLNFFLNTCIFTVCCTTADVTYARTQLV